MSAIFDKYLKMNNLQNTCLFFLLVDYQAITFLREMLLLKMALMLLQRGYLENFFSRTA
jgi:hypothetical protein